MHTTVWQSQVNFKKLYVWQLGSFIGESDSYIGVSQAIIKVYGTVMSNSYIGDS